MAIKTKIMLWYTVLLVLLLGIVIPLIYFTMKSTMYDNAESMLRIHTSQALEDFEYEHDTMELYGFKNISGTSFILFDADNSLITNTGASDTLNSLAPDYDNISEYKTEQDSWLIYDQSIQEEGRTVGWIRAYASLESVYAALQNLKTIIAIASPIYIIIGILGGLFISKNSLKPIDDITKTAQIISTGDLSQRLEMPDTGDEVSRLAQTFDRMIDKLDESFEKEKRFTANASHELRTPVSVIMAASEDALNGEHSVKDYQDALTTILSESKKMRGMISKLLMLSKGDEASLKYAFENIDLGLLIEGVVEEMLEYAKQKNILISYGYKEDVMIKADQTLIIRLVMNLLDNAIKYSNENSQIEVFLNKKKDCAEIVVKDCGIGIPTQELDKIFNRFYRVDKSRSGEGIGLGLPLVKHIVDIHKGSISVKSELSVGTKFTVRLPFES